MCSGGGGGSTSKASTQTVVEKKPVYMRNPWLDGLGINSEARGRNSLVNGGGPSADTFTAPNTAAGFLGIGQSDPHAGMHNWMATTPFGGMARTVLGINK